MIGPALLGIGLSVLLTIAATSSESRAPAPAAAPCQKFYGVIHRVTVDAQGRITETAVEHVVDPDAGATPEEAADHPIQMELPAAYLAAARAFLARRSYRGQPTTFWTYTLYDPAQPERADIASPADCRPRTSGTL